MQLAGKATRQETARAVDEGLPVYTTKTSKQLFLKNF
jgi:hypothetical protein